MPGIGSVNGRRHGRHEKRPFRTMKPAARRDDKGKPPTVVAYRGVGARLQLGDEIPSPSADWRVVFCGAASDRLRHAGRRLRPRRHRHRPAVRPVCGLLRVPRGPELRQRKLPDRASYLSRRLRDLNRPLVPRRCSRSVRHPTIEGSTSLGRRETARATSRRTSASPPRRTLLPGPNPIPKRTSGQTPGEADAQA
jgi:hypothetical protein